MSLIKSNTVSKTVIVIVACQCFCFEPINSNSRLIFTSVRFDAKVCHHLSYLERSVILKLIFIMSSLLLADRIDRSFHTQSSRRTKLRFLAHWWCGLSIIMMSSPFWTVEVLFGLFVRIGSESEITIHFRLLLLHIAHRAGLDHSRANSGVK